MLEGLTDWPRKDVFCPRCDTRVVYSHQKPYCPKCYWNLEKVRRHGWRQARNGLIVSVAFLLVAALFRLGLPLVIVGAIGIVVHAISALRVRQLPRPPVTQALAEAADEPPIPRQHRAVLRKAAHWVFKLSVHPALLVAMCTVFGFWAYLDTNAFNTLTKSTIVLAALFGYVLISEVRYTILDIRQFSLERHVALNPAITSGNVIQEVPRTAANHIRYKFRDPAGKVEFGSGDDLTGTLFENMQVTIVFDPDRPKYNTPVPGMRFFTAMPLD